MPFPLLRAVLDANVLFPIVLCDTLLRAAVEQLFRPFWNAEILDEMERNLILQRRTTPSLARRRRAALQSAFPLAMVTGYARLMPVLTNDPKDRHVLATAIRAGAQVIVTQNLRHFPASSLAAYAIEVQSADDFLQDLLRVEPEVMIRILREQAADLTRPPQSADQVLARLGLEPPDFVRAVRAHESFS